MKTFVALYDTMLRTQFNRARVIALGLLGSVGIVVAWALGRSAETSLTDRVVFVNGFGLAIVLPVTTLVFASSSLGDMTEDQTLIYIWLRNVARWQIAASAMLSTLTIVVPLVVLPLVVSGIAARLDATSVIASAVATAIGAVAYTGAFTALGMRARRALMWGLLYIFIWEQFIARASIGVRRFALSAYTRTTLSKLSDVQLRLADISLTAAIVVPLAVGLAGFAYVSRRLERHDVA